MMTETEAALVEAGEFTEREAARHASRRVLERATEAFISASEDRYDSGDRAAASDIHKLELIATKIAAFVWDMSAEFERLDVARDVEMRFGIGVQVKRAEFKAVMVAEMIAEALSHEALGYDAGAVLMALVKREMG